MAHGLLRFGAALLGAALAAPAAIVSSGRTTSTAWDWLTPDVVLTDRDRQRLGRGDVVVRTLPAGDAHLAVFAATPVAAAPERLVEWTRRIEDYKRSTMVLAIGRFSPVPEPGDLDTLLLDDVDVDAVRNCTASQCPLKLTGPEIDRLRAAADGREGWRPRVQQAFRSVVAERVRTYLAGGLAALPDVADGGGRTNLQETFEAIVGRSAFLSRDGRTLGWLGRPGGADDVESFVYWSKERYELGKTVVTVTHVGIIRGAGEVPPVVVLSKQIMATRYVTGALGVAAMLPDARGGHILTYVNRSSPDLLRGVMGRLVRNTMEERTRRSVPDAIRLARTRLESGSPRPPASTAR